jgi:hypothetical protein
MDISYFGRVREAEYVREVLQVFVVIGESVTADAALIEP